MTDAPTPLSPFPFPFAVGALPMPELRKDPIVGRWVIIATDRAKRPVSPKVEPLSPGTGYCPFCEGHEEKTPGEILAYRDRNTRPNGARLASPSGAQQIPRLQVEGDLNKRGEGIYDKMNGVGAHRGHHRMSISRTNARQSFGREHPGGSLGLS